MPARRGRSRSRKPRSRSRGAPASRIRSTAERSRGDSAAQPAATSMRLTELQGMADSAGIAYSGMTKAQIIEALKKFTQG